MMAQGSLMATHIIGGEITYKCLGNDSFLINLTVFRDCYNGVPPFDPQASIGVFDDNWGYLTQYLIPYTSDDTLDVTLNDPCLQVPPDVCVHRSSYSVVAYLPFRVGGYHLVYQRCCRNLLIQNIYDPEATGASFVAQITEASLLGCNNSAVFRQWPPVAICIHQPIDFDHGATDADGDSLVYRICTPNSGATVPDPMPQPPYAGPYAPVLWIDPPYGLGNVLGGTPLTIDPNTGYLTGIPNKLGNFVVGICVEEYRNGVLISSTNRDFQYNVADCGIVSAAISAPAFVCDTLGVKFINQSGTNGTYQWYFDWPNLSPSSTEVSPVHQYPDTGTYTVALIVNPDLPCNDTAFVSVNLRDLTASADFDLTTGTCDSAGLSISVSNLASDTVYGLQWVRWRLIGPGIDVGLPDWEPMFSLIDPGFYTLTMTVRSLNGCEDVRIDTFEVPIPDLTALDTLLEVCSGQSVPLFPNGDPDFIYTWSPSTYLDNAQSAHPICTPSANITYQVTSTHPVSGCTETSLVHVELTNVTHGQATATPNTVILGQSSQLEYLNNPPLSIQWTPATVLSDPNIVDPVATPTQDSTLFTAIATYPGGCLDTVQVLVRAFTPICDEPFVFFPTAFSPNGDMQNDSLGIEGTYIQAVYWAIYDRWGELIFEANKQSDRWDGTFGGKLLPPDTYGYYLKVLCLGGGTLSKKGNVTLLR